MFFKENLRLYSILPLFFVVVVSSFSFAQDGTLDLTFATNGKLTYLPSNGLVIPEKTQIKVQPDLKILQVGTDGTSSNFMVLRYNADGKSLDNSFNGNGIAAASFDGCRAYSLCLTPDGKILAAGRTFNGSKHIFAVARFNSDGSIDNSFNSSGEATVEFTSAVSYAYSVAAQPNGKILLAGYTGSSGNTDIAVARLNADGSIDNSFGLNGTLTIDFNGKDDAANDVLVQTDGKIVIAGSVTGTTSDFGIVRLNADGSFDNTFGTGGKVSKDIGGTFNSCSALALQTDGKIVVSGSTVFNPSTSADSYSTVARFNADGTSDNSFNGSGSILISFSTYLRDEGNSVGIQKDGKIVVAGNRFDGSTEDFAVARLNSDGTLDNTFNGSGKVVISAAPGDETGYSLASQSNSLIIAGKSSDRFALIRLNNSSGFLTLPVKLSSFSAVQQKEGIQLSWVAEYEKNFSEFEIERSSNGSGYFTIGKIGIGGKNKTAYTFLDQNPNHGKNYYRLKITAEDGKVNYSKTVLLNIDPRGSGITVYPNPARNVLNIQINVVSGGKMAVLDGVGKIVKQVSFSAGNSSFSIDIAELPKGVYFLDLGGLVRTRFCKN